MLDKLAHKSQSCDFTTLFKPLDYIRGQFRQVTEVVLPEESVIQEPSRQSEELEVQGDQENEGLFGGFEI